MIETCKIFLYPCKKREHDSKQYLKYQRQYVNKIMQDVMENEFQISYSNAMIERDMYGKPFLKDFPYVHYNISHCEGYIACGISNKPIGIDVENVREYPDQVFHRTFSSKEKEYVESAISKDLRFFQLWTLKESYIKAIGKGLSFPLEEIFFTLEESGEIISNHPEGYFSQFYLEETQFVLSVCTFQEVQVQVMRWKEECSDE